MRSIQTHIYFCIRFIAKQIQSCLFTAIYMYDCMHAQVCKAEHIMRSCVVNANKIWLNIDINFLSNRSQIGYIYSMTNKHNEEYNATLLLTSSTTSQAKHALWTFQPALLLTSSTTNQACCRTCIVIMSTSTVQFRVIIVTFNQQIDRYCFLLQPRKLMNEVKQ